MAASGAGQPEPGPGAAPGTAPLPDDPADDHYVPPPPPPLPRLDPVTKGAWLALFGGPLYLLIATAVGGSISGLAAFLSVAAFVGGFVSSSCAWTTAAAHATPGPTTTVPSSDEAPGVP